MSSSRSFTMREPFCSEPNRAAWVEEEARRQAMKYKSYIAKCVFVLFSPLANTPRSLALLRLAAPTIGLSRLRRPLC